MKRTITFFIILCLLLTGCGVQLPADGNPGDVTCKGTYTTEAEDYSPDTVVARVGEAELTNAELQVWYWAAVADYRNSGAAEQPDYESRLDAQPCTVDATVNSWQQYFLARALEQWHTATALDAHSAAVGLSAYTDPAYQPKLDWWEQHLVDMPAVRAVYRYTETLGQGYRRNTMHADYLEQLPDLLQETAVTLGYEDAAALAAAMGTTAADLLTAAEAYNKGYMYFADMSRYLESEETADTGVQLVNIRHILLVPMETDKFSVSTDEKGVVTCDEELWAKWEKQAAELLKDCKANTRQGTETALADAAFAHSQDTGSAGRGGLYENLSREQLLPVLGDWCFAEDRAAGDSAVLRSEYGVHIVYLVSYSHADSGAVQAADLQAQQQQLLAAAKAQYPMEVTYSAIALTAGAPVVSLEALLYPDVAHQNVPELPLFYQCDYPDTTYGGQPMLTHGCGITALTMVASYILDEELSPADMAGKYGRYCSFMGTDVTLLMYEPSRMGVYLEKYSYSGEEVKQALLDGKMVISRQLPGYWTNMGHYIALEKINEDGTVQVRDSEIRNCSRLASNKQDSHAWSDITRNNGTYFIFQKKEVTNPVCHRCGDPEQASGSPVLGEYTCGKCNEAQLRRMTYTAYQ